MKITISMQIKIKTLNFEIIFYFFQNKNTYKTVLIIE